MAKVKITKSVTRNGVTTTEAASIKAATLEKMADIRLKQVERMENTINRLLDSVAETQKKDPKDRNTTQDLMQRIKLEEAIMGLHKAQLSHTLSVKSFEKRLEEINRNAYKDNKIYKAYQAVKTEQNSPVTATMASIGVSALTGGVINPMIARALHLDKALTAPITALTRGLLSIGHTTSSAVKNAEDAERNELLQEISNDVKGLNKKVSSIGGKVGTAKEKSGGLLSFLGDAVGGIAAIFAGKWVLNAIGAPEWLQKVLPPAMAGYMIGGLPGALVGGLFGLFSDEIINGVSEAFPAITQFFKDLPANLNAWLKDFLEKNPAIKHLGEVIEKKINDIAEKAKDTIKEKAKDFAIGAAETLGAMGLAWWGGKKGTQFLLKKGLDLAKKGVTALKNSIFGAKAGATTVKNGIFDAKAGTTAVKNGIFGAKAVKPAVTATAKGTFEASSAMVKAADQSLMKTAVAANDNLVKTAANTSRIVKTGTNILKSTGRAAKGFLSPAAVALDAGIGTYETIQRVNQEDPRKSVTSIAKDQITDYFYEDVRALHSDAVPWYLKPFILGGMVIDSAKSLGSLGVMGGAALAESNQTSNNQTEKLTRNQYNLLEENASLLSEKLAEAVQDPNSIGMRQLHEMQKVNENFENLIKVNQDMYTIEHNYRKYLENKGQTQNGVGDYNNLIGEEGIRGNIPTPALIGMR